MRTNFVFSEITAVKHLNLHLYTYNKVTTKEEKPSDPGNDEDRNL